MRKHHFLTMTFLVNSKILHGHITGVQRYLLEIMANISGQIEKVQPRRSFSGLRGHIWEQFILPFRINKNLLWSPSNTGPLAVTRQVLTIHDVVPLDHPEWLNWKFAAWYRFLLPRLVLRARRVIAISEFTKERLLATTKISPEKIIVIPNGVDVRFHPRPEAEVTAAINALEVPARRYLLTVGSLEPRKNLRRLLAAWRQAHASLPEDVWLVVAGGKGKVMVFGDTTGAEELPPRVYLTGHVPDHMLPALYAGAAAFAYVSEYEGFGLPPLEAMASGVPVLVSNTTAFPEVVSDAGLYTNPLDVDEIARGLIRLLTDPALATDLMERGLRRAKQFSWERTAALTLKVLREAAEEG
jgi:glycosyltransferase involved in cell wall biosynthesis